MGDRDILTEPTRNHGHAATAGKIPASMIAVRVVWLRSPALGPVITADKPRPWRLGPPTDLQGRLIGLSGYVHE